MFLTFPAKKRLAQALCALVLCAFGTTARAGIEPGEVTLGEMNCVACHAAGDNVAIRLASRQSPRLGTNGVRISPTWMRDFLINPQSVKPGTMMPDMLHGLSPAQKAIAAEALAHYLASIQPEDLRATPDFNSAMAARGRNLYHEAGCVACHAPQALPADSSSAQDRISLTDSLHTTLPLDAVVGKYSVNALGAFLREPLKSRPSGRMPSLRLTESEARCIAMYLLRDQALSDTNVVKTQGLGYESYTGQYDKLPDFERITPAIVSRTTQFGPNPGRGGRQTAIRFHGKLAAPAEGEYRFWTSSDDGSQLFIDGRLVVDNDGTHAVVERNGTAKLTAGDHSIVVTYFDKGGDRVLRVSWSGPGFEKKEIAAESLFIDDGQRMRLADDSFAVDPDKAAKGKELFAKYNCAACHQVEQPGKMAAPLAALKRTDRGCLATKVPSGAADFSLTEAKRKELKSVLANLPQLAKPLVAADQVHRTMTALNCFACHSRGTNGPAEGLRREYFKTVGKVDLGEEGRMPPPLNGVGAKLKPAWLEKVLETGATVRPYMATRMPVFGEANVKALETALVTADSPIASVRGVAIDPAMKKYGQQMIGTTGASCISCHTFAGHASLGVPAMDLTAMAERLNSDWFHRYLLNPPSLRPGTRMPSYWPEGTAAIRTVLEGDTEKQITAIWSYLSDGTRAALPPGLIPARIELVADKEPRIYRNFITGAGPRAIGVGYPEKVDLAFDADQMRVAMLWQGSFMDAGRHWTARGEGFEPPMGFDLVQFPSGAPFAILNAPEAAWPESTGKAAGYQFRGYVFDEARRPAFHYQFQQVAIEDLFVPVVPTNSPDRGFRRSLVLKSAQAVENLWFRAALADDVRDLGNDSYLVNGNVKLAIRPGTITPAVPGDFPALRTSLRKTSAGVELLVPVRFRDGEAQIVEEISW